MQLINRRKHRGPGVEFLENRRLLTTVVVNSLGDSASITNGQISLAAAVAEANTSTTPTSISFDPTVFAAQQTINLMIGGIVFTNTAEPTTIVGPASGVVIKNTLAGVGNQVMQVDNGVTASLSNVVITGGTYAGILSQGNLTLTNSTVSGNAGYPSGGGLLTLGGTVNLTGDTFTNNTGSNGGAVELFTGTRATLINDTITGNNATAAGGGLDITDSSATVEGVSISGNFAGNGVGGGINFTSNNGVTNTLTIGNSIIAGNSGQQVSITGAHSTITSLGNNLIGDDFLSDVWTPSDIIESNPQLGALGNNGGPTQTLLPLAGSPAIDAGSVALIPADVITDQRGQPRTIGGTVDIGAVEFHNPLSGIAIGTPGSWDGSSTIQKVFDRDLTTYFDPGDGNLTDWVGLDLGKSTLITQISYAPRAGYSYRMDGGQFQVSSTPDFSADVHTIYTIRGIPADGLTTVDVNPSAGYRYIRYTGGSQWVNIAEMQVFGLQVQPPLEFQSFSGTPIGTPASWNPQTTVTAAFDGNQGTFFDPANANLSNWAGLDLGTPQTVTQITFAPRIGYEFRMVGGQFQVSSMPDFSSDVHTVYTITAAPADGLTTVTFPAVGAFRYIRYTGGTQWVNISEMSVAGQMPPVPFTGTAIGTTASWNSQTSITAAFDGDLSTFFDPATGDLTNWVGLDLGTPTVVTQIKFAPRAGYAFRMIGGEFQASNTADFSSGVVTLATIVTPPPANQVTTIAVNLTDVAYRYYRYTGGTQWVNIAEMELDGPG